jgi:hypothetical protein
MTVADALGTLTTLGISPVIVLGATIFIAGVLYKRFRR